MVRALSVHREAGHGLTEEELSEEESDSETEEVGPLEKRTDQSRASGQLGPPGMSFLSH